MDKRGQAFCFGTSTLEQWVDMPQVNQVAPVSREKSTSVEGTTQRTTIPTALRLQVYWLLTGEYTGKSRLNRFCRRTDVSAARISTLPADILC
jgi:hypothetical protein